MVVRPVTKWRGQVTDRVTGRVALILGVLMLIGFLVHPLLPVASASGGTVAGSFTVLALTPTPTATPTYGDPYEVDDTPQSASWIYTTGTAQTHSFHPPGDVDYIKFQAVAGCSYTVTAYNIANPYPVAASSISAGAYIVLEFYGSDVLTDPGAQPLATVDGSLNGGIAFIAWDVVQSGVYYVKIRERLDRGYGLWYQVSVARGGEKPFKVFMPIVGMGTSHWQGMPLRLPSIMSTRSQGLGIASPSAIRANLRLASPPHR